MSDHHRRSNPRQNSRPPWFPPRTPAWSWRPLPAWEKRFCVEVGAMSWKRFFESKKNIQGVDNRILSWDDSAGRVAFENAKERFWAQYHGFPCHKSLPSTDLYIDKNIDWNSEIDSAIWPDDEDKEPVVEELDWSKIPLHEIRATGWDDCYTGPHLPKVVGY